MPQVIEYLKNNWIDLAAIFISFISLITSFIVLMDSRKIKLAEKRYKLRILLANGRIENLSRLKEIQSSQELLDKDIEYIAQKVSRNDQHAEKWRQIHQLAMDIRRTVDTTTDAINNVQKQLDIFYEGMLISNKIKAPSYFIELLGRADESLRFNAENKKNTEKITELIKTVHDEIRKIPQ